MSDAGKFSNSANGFFTLADHGDTATVRFLYDQPDASDMDYFVVHEIETEGKKRYVACNAILEDGKTVDPGRCVLCSSGFKRIEKLFLQLYHVETDAVETWDRGPKFVPKIQTYINMYDDLVGREITIQRCGKKNDNNTSYELFVKEADGKTLADFPEKQELLGGFILELTDEDMQAVLNGTYKVPRPDDAGTQSGAYGRRTATTPAASRPNAQARSTDQARGYGRQGAQPAPEPPREQQSSSYVRRGYGRK